MKTLFVALLILLSVPYLIGRLQFNNAVAVVQNLGNDDSDAENIFGSDGDIENVLAVFNFQIGALDTPTFSDYYKAGLQTIF